MSSARSHYSDRDSYSVTSTVSRPSRASSGGVDWSSAPMVMPTPTRRARPAGLPATSPATSDQPSASTHESSVPRPIRGAAHAGARARPASSSSSDGRRYPQRVVAAAGSINNAGSADDSAPSAAGYGSHSDPSRSSPGVATAALLAAISRSPSPTSPPGGGAATGHVDNGTPIVRGYVTDADNTDCDSDDEVVVFSGEVAQRHSMRDMLPRRGNAAPGAGPASRAGVGDTKPVDPNASTAHKEAHTDTVEVTPSQPPAPKAAAPRYGSAAASPIRQAASSSASPSSGGGTSRGRATAASAASADPSLPRHRAILAQALGTAGEQRSFGSATIASRSLREPPKPRSAVLQEQIMPLLSSPSPYGTLHMPTLQDRLSQRQLRRRHRCGRILFFLAGLAPALLFYGLWGEVPLLQQYEERKSAVGAVLGAVQRSAFLLVTVPYLLLLRYVRVSNYVSMTLLYALVIVASIIMALHWELRTAVGRGDGTEFNMVLWSAALMSGAALQLFDAIAWSSTSPVQPQFVRYMGAGVTVGSLVVPTLAVVQVIGSPDFSPDDHVQWWSRTASKDSVSGLFFVLTAAGMVSLVVWWALAGIASSCWARLCCSCCCRGGVIAVAGPHTTRGQPTTVFAQAATLDTLETSPDGPFWSLRASRVADMGNPDDLSGLGTTRRPVPPFDTLPAVCGAPQLSDRRDTVSGYFTSDDEDNMTASTYAWASDGAPITKAAARVRALQRKLQKESTGGNHPAGLHDSTHSASPGFDPVQQVAIGNEVKNGSPGAHVTDLESRGRTTGLSAEQSPSLSPRAGRGAGGGGDGRGANDLLLRAQGKSPHAQGRHGVSSRGGICFFLWSCCWCCCRGFRSDTWRLLRHARRRLVLLAIMGVINGAVAPGGLSHAAAAYVPYDSVVPPDEYGVGSGTIRSRHALHSGGHGGLSDRPFDVDALSVAIAMYCCAVVLGRVTRGVAEPSWAVLVSVVVVCVAATCYLITTSVVAVYVGQVLPSPFLGAMLLVASAAVIGWGQGFVVAHVWLDILSRDFRAGSSYDTVFELCIAATATRRASELAGATLVAALAAVGLLS